MLARGAFEYPFFVSCAVLKNIGMKTAGTCDRRFISSTATSLALACKPDALRRVNSAERARDDHHMAPATPFRYTDFVFVAMELMEGNLIEFQSAMSVLGAASVAHEVARALAFTARRGLHYVDMKLSNILYRRCANSTDRYEIRLCDIGSVVAADETPYTTYPCIFNMLQRTTPSQSDQNARNGVWGVFVLFVLLCDALEGIEYDLRYTRLEEISDASGHSSSVARLTLTDHLSNIIDALHQRLSDRPDVLRAVDMLMRYVSGGWG
jgi:serine/threonine protein kinase